VGWSLLAGGSRWRGDGVRGRGGPRCCGRLRGAGSSGLGGRGAQRRLGLRQGLVSGQGGAGGGPVLGADLGGEGSHLGHHNDHKVFLINAVLADGDIIAQDLPSVDELLPSHGEGITALLRLNLLLQCPHLGAQGVRGCPPNQPGLPETGESPPA